MSFKRDGNDDNMLGILRKRRIQDLLGVDVPEDEALLMKNGKFACLVCGHRPVFDTMDMLSIHRKGKKHLANQEYWLENKLELNDLIEQRKQEQYLKNGTTNIKQAKLEHRGLGMGPAYDPRAKKLKPNQRKQTLAILPTASEIPVASSVNNLPGYRHKSCLKSCSSTGASGSTADVAHDTGSFSFKSNQTFRDMLLLNGPLKHPKQLKKIFEQPEKQLQPHVIKPYVSEKLRTQGGLKRSHDVQQSCDRGPSSMGDVCSRPIQDSLKKKRHSSKEPKNSMNSQEHVTSSVTDERRKKTEKYLQYRGAGWKKDLDGKWVKDEDAEFDSDEEPPDLP